MPDNMPQNRYIRPCNEAEAINFGLPKYYSQTLSDHRSALFLSITVEEGGCGPTLHYHQSDQIYFLTRGSVEILLDDTTYDVPANSLIFIPAGVPHKNINNGKGTEAHLEMLFPSPDRFQYLAHFIEDPSKVPAEWQTKRKAYVRTIQDLKAVESRSGSTIIPLADPSSGSDHVHIYHEEVSSKPAANSTMHINEFDQYYFVLEGELSVEVAFQKYVAGKETLVVLPAGVPFRTSNVGQTTVKQLSLLVPPPDQGRLREVGVSLAASGDVYEEALPSAVQ